MSALIQSNTAVPKMMATLPSKRATAQTRFSRERTGTGLFTSVVHVVHPLALSARSCVKMLLPEPAGWLLVFEKRAAAGASPEKQML